MSASTLSDKKASPASGLWPVLGCGVGLRAEHYNHILSEKPKVDWFEAITENFMDSGGRPIQILAEIRKHYPILLHGVSLSIGSADPLDEKYLSRLKALVDRIEPAAVSDHLCWSGVEGESLHDLLPLPLTEEAADYVAERVQKVQDYLGRRIMIENVSTYVTFKHSTMPEWEFLTEVARRAGCGILLDLNNIYVNSKNHGFDPEVYVRSVPGELVGQFHLAGHTDMGAFLFDTHKGSIVNPVWNLYEKALALYGQVSTLVEWDAEIPDFSRLMEEAGKARVYYDRAAKIPGGLRGRAAAPKAYSAKSHEAWKGLLEDQRRLKTLVRPGVAPAAGAAEMLNPQGGASGKERMDVYAGGYVARIHESLTETYEAIKHVLGDASFCRLAEEYAAARPSHSYNLSEAGRELAEYLETAPVSQKFGFLPDLARLERLIADSFHAWLEKPFDPSVLAGIDEDGWDSLKLRFQPSVKVFASKWPVLDVWSARHTPLKDISIDLVGRPQNVIVYRVGGDVRCLGADDLQRDLVAALMAGKTLGEAIQSLGPDADPPLQEWFAFWASQGLLSGAR